MAVGRGLLEHCVEDIARSAEALAGVLAGGGTILVCGNGGSAAQAQHLAAELVGRFRGERPGLRALALTTDTSVLTAVANDYRFEEVYRRQVQALGRPGDGLVAISTSGESPNVLAACEAARGLGMLTVGLVGRGGGRLASVVDHAVVVPSDDTCRIQECHQLVTHTFCEAVEATLAARAPRG
ncbi:MAG: SIS domain-containing protein [Planctomycetes bacterium]|nr:SIS domain-containing protein [Planctomycetota bacterium]